MNMQQKLLFCIGYLFWRNTFFNFIFFFIFLYNKASVYLQFHETVHIVWDTNILKQ